MDTDITAPTPQLQAFMDVPGQPHISFPLDIAERVEMPPSIPDIYGRAHLVVEPNRQWGLRWGEGMALCAFAPPASDSEERVLELWVLDQVNRLRLPARITHQHVAEWLEVLHNVRVLEINESMRTAVVNNYAFQLKLVEFYEGD